MSITKNLKLILSVFCFAGFISNIALAGNEAVGEDGTAYYFLNQDPGYFYLTPKFGWNFTNTNDWNDDSGLSQTFGPLSQPDKNVDTYIAGIAAGYKFTGFPFRMDVNYFYINDRTYNFSPIYQNYFANSTGRADVSSHIFLLNFYYDWYTSTKLTPYVGAGAGEYFNKTNFTAVDPSNSAAMIEQKNTTNGLAWDIALGLRYDFNPNWALSLEGNFIGINKASAKETLSDGTILPFATQDNMKTFNLMLGLTYKLN